MPYHPSYPCPNAGDEAITETKHTSTDLKKMKSQWWWGSYTETKHTSTDLKKMKSQWWWGSYTETKYTSTDLKTVPVTIGMQQSQRQNILALTWRHCRSRWGCGNHRDKTYQRWPEDTAGHDGDVAITETKHTSTDLKTMQVTMGMQQSHTDTETKHTGTDLKTMQVTMVMRQ